MLSHLMSLFPIKYNDYLTYGVFVWFMPIAVLTYKNPSLQLELFYRK